MFSMQWVDEVRRILHLAIPLIISNIAIIGMEIIDTIMAGQASADDLAGLAIGGNVWLILEVAMGGLISAITPRISRFYGANQSLEIKCDTQQGLLLGALVGTVAMFVMLALVPYLPQLGADPEVTVVAQGYTNVIAYSLPVSGICWVLFCLLEGHSLMRFVVWSSIVAMLLNILFDYIFVFGKFGFPALGGVGCAWTTTSIYWLWGVACVVYTAQHALIKKYKIYASWPRFDWPRWRAILALGIPISLALLAEEGFFNIATLLIAPLGTEALGAHHITIQVVSLVLMFGLGIGQATAIRVARRIGKSQTQEMLEKLMSSFYLVTATSLSVGVGIFVFRENVPHLFTQDISIAAISSTIMLMAPVYLICDVLQIWAAQTLRGFEDTKMPMFIQITSFWLIGFPLAYTLGLTSWWGESYGVYGFWIGFFSGVLIASCLLCSRLYLKAYRFNP